MPNTTEAGLPLSALLEAKPPVPSPFFFEKVQGGENGTDLWWPWLPWPTTTMPVTTVPPPARSDEGHEQP